MDQDTFRERLDAVEAWFLSHLKPILYALFVVVIVLSCMSIHSAFMNYMRDIGLTG
ncbi:hypothetical protein [Rhizobium sp. GN54]|uniref:hypothetical protein n=1 Tax=Rhizobium sp. GN54 TaxID=2898150 RepID=UPI001E29563D|nr:hypothetical protein [Rhizobium sp. GN54]MCD2182234.1 hypothetical protein [Rhizobium sp. GN54]